MEDDNWGQSFTGEIINLISMKQEGGFWDFKREWYEKKHALLHDIICMANNLQNRNAYIIIGIDEEKNYSIADVKQDPNRKNTQKLVDFLRDKKFAGGIRPLVYVESISLPDGEIDVIVIKNSHSTPFYLTESFESVRANYIYTRVMDTNTPIDKSADLNNVEYLWRKRFHMDETPLERVSFYLSQPQNWAESPIEHETCKFYRPSPEFIIREEPDDRRTGYEFYLFGQMDSHPHWYTVTLYYYQTALEQFLGIALDGGRCFVIAPEISGVSFTQYAHWDLSFRYFEKDSLRYSLLQFLYHKEQSDRYSYMRYMECILVFDTEFERKRFEMYIREHSDIYHSLYEEQGDCGLPFFPDLKGYNMDKFKEDYRNALVLQKMLDSFRER